MVDASSRARDTSDQNQMTASDGGDINSVELMLLDCLCDPFHRFGETCPLHPVVVKKDQVFDKWNFGECIGILLGLPASLE